MAETVKYEKGQVLFQAGATSREMYIIKAGLLSIYITKKEQTIELATIGDGEVLGEMVKSEDVNIFSGRQGSDEAS